MATTNTKKRKKLSWSTVLLVVMRILPIIIEGLNRESEGNLEVADIQFQFNPFTGKLDAFVDTGLDKDTVHRTENQTVAPTTQKAVSTLQARMSKSLSNEGIGVALDFRG